MQLQSRLTKKGDSQGRQAREMLERVPPSGPCVCGRSSLREEMHPWSRPAVVPGSRKPPGTHNPTPLCASVSSDPEEPRSWEGGS